MPPTAPPPAVQATNAVWHGTSHLSVRGAYARMRSGAIPEYQRMKQSDDYLEGPRAFAEKREPVFKGR